MMTKHLQKTIHKAWALRKRHINHTTTNAYRLINSYGDALPEVTIDVYDKHLLVQYFKSYERHARDELYGILKGLLSPATITEKMRLKGADVKTEAVLGTEIPKDFVVLENDIKFMISFREGGSTGLFLDQRENRRRVQSLCKDKTVLNCFCYTSSFSVYAAIGGAVKTTNVDISKKAIDWSRKNFLLNGIDGASHEFIVGDVWDWANLFQKRGRMFDVIIIDPPTFSTSKTNVLAIEKDIPRLLGLGLNLLHDDGVLIFSTNLAKMGFSKFFQLLPRLKDFTPKTYKLINTSTQGLDFPIDGLHFTEPYLKFVMLSC